jgi:hemerythrin
MRASEVRAELMEQHAELRVMATGLLHVAERAREGEAVHGELSSVLARFTDALRRHNSREEVLLRDILPTVDTWGPAHDRILTEEHVQEHAELNAAIVGIPRTPDEFAGAATQDLVASILEHMAREEQLFLGEDTLRDDSVVVEGDG